MEAPAPTTPPPAATPSASAPGDSPAAESTQKTLPTPAPKANGKASNGKTEAKPSTDDAKAEGAKPEEELFEVNVKGEKRRLTREQAIRELQKGFASNENFRKAKELEQKASGVLGSLKERTEDALKEAGVDVEAFARQVLQRRVEAAVEETLPPEERQARQEKRELEQLRQQVKQQEEAAAKAKLEAQEKAVFAHLEKNIIAAAQRNGIEGTPDSLKRIAETASELIELEIPFTEDQLMAEVKEREDAAMASLEKRVLGGLKGEALAKRLGPQVVQEVLRWSVENIRGRKAAPPPSTSTAPSTDRPTNYITDSEFRRKHGY